MTIALSRRAAVMIPTTAREAREACGRHEIRTATMSEVRASRDGSEIRVEGYAAVFDSPSLDLGGWYEVIQRGAFRKVLSAAPDVRFMVNHGGLPYARTTNGSLTVTEDTRGLRFAANLADVSEARDLTTLLERGDVSQMSFAFRVAPDGVEWDVDDDKRERRTITEFMEFDEISAVTFPAYPDTTVSASSSDEPGDRSQRQDPDEQANAGGDLEGGRPVDACAGSSSSDDDGVDLGVRARAAARRRRLQRLYAE